MFKPKIHFKKKVVIFKLIIHDPYNLENKR